MKVSKSQRRVNDLKPQTRREGMDKGFASKYELSNYDSLLLFYPERAFEFTNAGKVLVKQSIADVGLTIWDAEVILAHYVDTLSLRGKKVLEIGGGTCLAGVVCAKLGAVVCTQDKEELTWIAQESFSMNDVSAVTVGCLWGADCAAAIKAKHGYSDIIIMADVVYHKEHFEALFKTVVSSSADGARIIISFEQRRADVSSFFDMFKKNFQLKFLHETIIECPDTKREAHVFIYDLCYKL